LEKDENSCCPRRTEIPAGKDETILKAKIPAVPKEQSLKMSDVMVDVDELPDGALLCLNPL
jgi:hypothetical protein